MAPEMTGASPDAKGAPQSARSCLTMVSRGKDKPGISMAFMKSLEGHDCQVMGITQFTLSGILVFTFELEIGEGSSYGLMKDMRLCADSQGMDLDFKFPDENSVDPQRDHRKAVLAIGSGCSISPSALCDVDAVLSQNGCTVEEIEHRSDNKIEYNGEFNKVQMIVRCPPGCSLATLYLGLIQVEGANVTVRWWDGMNRPHGKSLVVFGLSNVLCPYNVLDELITETGVDAGTMKSLGDSDVSPAAREKKIALLKGKSVKAADSLIERLTFTKGASMVCSTLKAMGCRLAILTNTGEKTIADHVKTKLGIDYMMSQQLEVQDGCFTGKFGGDAHDIRFRKLDLIKLMADKEGIEYRNVIVVGESLKGLKLGTAKSMLETFGPNVFFNSNTYSNLAIVLYQLGFSGSHVEELRQRYEPEAVEKIPKSMTEGAVAEGYEAVYVEVSAPAGLPAHIQKVIASLKPFQSQVTISTVRQCSLSNGSTCLGLKLVLEKGSTERVTKELLFACQKASLKVTLHQVPESVQPAACRPNLYVITIVQVPSIPTSTLKAVFEALAGEGVNVSRMVQLSKKTLKALTLSVALPKDMDESKVAVVLGEVSKRHGCDIAFQKDDVDRFMRRMIVFDMDSTLIQQEVIDELARIAGVETAVKAITESAMRGEIDFFGSLKERCALLKGANCKKLFGDVKHSIQFNPGAERLCSVLRRLGYKMAVLSGGFQPIAEEVARRLRLDYAFANSLEVDEQTGLLTGLTSGPVVTPQRKRALLATISNVEECKVQQTIAVGDGANDIPMLHTAGLGIAFCAKAKVQEVAEFRINQKDLSTVLFLIGLSEHAIERLADCSEADSQGAPLVNEAPGASPKRRRMDP